MIIGTLLKEIASILKAGDIQDPTLEAELIFSEVLDKKRNEIYFLNDAQIDRQKIKKINELATIRSQTKTPLQYLFGVTYFRELKLDIRPPVLIPRPETEQLVELAQKRLNVLNAPKVLELCAGSGAIILSLATELKAGDYEAVELNKEAYTLCCENIVKIQPRNEVLLYLGDLFSPLVKDAKYDLIISNPPYVSKQQYALLPKEIQQYESPMALTDGGDGLSIIQKIIQQAPNYLNPNGALYLEIGETQGDAVEKLLSQSFTEISIQRDLADRVRFAIATLKK